MNLIEEIDFTTFLRFTTIKFREKEFLKEIHSAFKAFDTTNKEYLSYDEIKSIITDFGPNLSSEKADKLLKDLGIEQNKKINYYDFVNCNL